MIPLTTSTAVDYYFRIAWKKNSINFKERLYVALLDNDGFPLGRKSICKGKFNECLIDEREIVYEALKLHSNNIILAHNHPNGNPMPSQCDITATQNLNIILTSLKITLLDHIILTENSYYSFKDEGLIEQVKKAG